MEPRSSSQVDPVQELLYEPVPTLQDITSFKIALRLCYEQMPSGDCCSFKMSGKFKYGKNLSDNLFPSCVPPLIKKIIRAHARLIDREMSNWIRDLEANIFNEMLISYRICGDYVNFCIWQQDGKIDEKKTAQNLSTNSKLSVLEKFGIMCKYCLKDEIDSISLQLFDQRFIDSVNFTKDCLLFYWICYKRNDLHKITVEGSVSIDEFMLDQSEVWDTMASADYFWDRLGAEDQISVARKLILADGPMVNHLKHLWSKMNHHQRSAVLSAIPVEVVVQFWQHLLEFELGYAIWTRIKNFINEEQFAKLISILSNGVGVITIDSQRNDKEVDLLVNLWNSAANHLKDYVLKYKRSEILSSYCSPSFSRRRHRRPRNMKFLLAVLSYATVDCRKNIIMEYGPRMIEHNDESVMKDVINLCDGLYN